MGRLAVRRHPRGGRSPHDHRGRHSLAHFFPGAKPLFYAPDVGGPLDFVSVHFYPKAGQVEELPTALRVYEVGKPLVVEEMFPLACSGEELLDFVDGSAEIADGWISFYWGRTIAESEAAGDLGSAIAAAWLRQFSAKAEEFAAPRSLRLETINIKNKAFEPSLARRPVSASRQSPSILPVLWLRRSLLGVL